jgi:predicted GIY-YIG superfamily endonuclease
MRKAREEREQMRTVLLIGMAFVVIAGIAACAGWWLHLSPEEKLEQRARWQADRRWREEKRQSDLQAAAIRPTYEPSTIRLALGTAKSSRKRTARQRRRQYRKLTPWYVRGAHNYSGRTDGKTILYRFYDSKGKLLYVGITNNFDRRLQQHLADKWWAPQIARTQKVLYPSRTAAQNAELRAIRSERPRHNVAHNQGFLGLPRRRQ